MRLALHPFPVPDFAGDDAEQGVRARPLKGPIAAVPIGRALAQLRFEVAPFVQQLAARLRELAGGRSPPDLARVEATRSSSVSGPVGGYNTAT